MRCLRGTAALGWFRRGCCCPSGGDARDNRVQRGDDALRGRSDAAGERAARGAAAAGVTRRGGDAGRVALPRPRLPRRRRPPQVSHPPPPPAPTPGSPPGPPRPQPLIPSYPSHFMAHNTAGFGVHYVKIMIFQLGSSLLIIKLKLQWGSSLHNDNDNEVIIREFIT